MGCLRHYNPIWGFDTPPRERGIPQTIIPRGGSRGVRYLINNDICEYML